MSSSLLSLSDVFLISGGDRVRAKRTDIASASGDPTQTFSFPGGDIRVSGSLEAQGRQRVEIEIVTHMSMRLSRIGFRFQYLADQPDAWVACRDSFHFLPNIKAAANHVAGDHFFRSPAAIFTHPTADGVALVPDVRVLAGNRPSPQYLDMGLPEDGAPWIEWGFASQNKVEHIYVELNDTGFDLPVGSVKLAGWIVDAPIACFPGVVTSLLWSEVAPPYLADRRPMVLDPVVYAERGYEQAIKLLWQPGPTAAAGGITPSTVKTESGAWRGRQYPDSVWFHSWFNNARTAFGLAEWGSRLDRSDWTRRAREIINLALSAPVEQGIFPCVYAPHDGGWVGSGDESGGADCYHLPDAAWTAIWIRKFHDELDSSVDCQDRLNGLGEFLIRIQDESGGFPTYVNRGTLTKRPILNNVAGGGICAWYLGEELLAGTTSPRSGDYARAIRLATRYLREQILPLVKFEDFELYFSCSRKPTDFFDPWTHLFGINTLSVQWCAEAFRVACLLGLDAQENRPAGQFCIDLLCLFQQVWNPPYLSFYAFGGFGVMNTDGEWNDARQAQFAETLLNWADFTGQSEYRERAVAAARAAFALMVCPEHEQICPNNYLGTDIHGEGFAMMAENYGHSGGDIRSHQSAFDWGTGSALTTAARLLRRGQDPAELFGSRDRVPSNE